MQKIGTFQAILSSFKGPDTQSDFGLATADQWLSIANGPGDIEYNFPLNPVSQGAGRNSKIACEFVHNSWIVWSYNEMLSSVLG